MVGKAGGVGGTHGEGMGAAGIGNTGTVKQTLRCQGYAVGQVASLQSVGDFLRNTLGGNLETVVIAHGEAGTVGARKAWRGIDIRHNNGRVYRAVIAETCHGFIAEKGVVSFVVAIVDGGS